MSLSTSDQKYYLFVVQPDVRTHATIISNWTAKIKMIRDMCEVHNVLAVRLLRFPFTSYLAIMPLV